MKTALMLLSAFLLTSIPAVAAETRLRVMVFNIAAGHGDVNRIIREIENAQPDIVGLQEVDKHWSARSDWRDQPALLAEALGMEVFYAPIYRIPHPEEDRPAREYGLAFLSRLPIRESQNHPLTRLTPQRADTEPEQKPGFPEIAVRADGQTIRLFNTHLDYRRDPRVRQIQVAETLARLRQIDGPAILLGDLNATPEKEELQPLFEHLRDAWKEETMGPGHTFPADNPDRRIDYLLVSDHFEVKHAEVISTTSSDHLPLVFDLVLRPGVD